MQLRRLLAAPSAAALVFLIAGCSIDAPFTAPIQRTVDVSLAASDASAASEATKKERHEQLIAQRDSIRRAAKALREASKGRLDLEKVQWKLFKRAWKAEQKLNKLADLDLLRCEPLEYAADAEVIGPKGGSLNIGPHKLVVPAGALTEEQLIVGTSPMGSLVQVQFGPHGLQFLKSASLSLSYSHCLAPSNFQFRLVYVDSGLRITELPPSKDRKGQDQVDGYIDHFSGYMIAY